MPTPQINYDALARQQGGHAVDYDALAQQQGGQAIASPSNSPASGPPSPSLLSSPSDILSTVGNHLANMVAGPIHAFTQPADPTNKQEMNASAPWSQGGAGKLGLGLYRMTAEPTVNALKTARQQYDAGNIGLNNKSTYDANGNYQPTAASSLLDAIPVAGSWARNISNDTVKNGALAGAAGFATDLLAPGAIAKGAGVALRGVSDAGKLLTTTPAARNLAATRFLTNGTPGQLLQSALKPGVKYGADAGAKLQEALPHVLAADPTFQGVSGFAKAADAAKDAAAQPYTDILAPYKQLPDGIPGPSRYATISGKPIQAAQNASIPAIDRFESPSAYTGQGGIIQSTAQKAATYNKNIPVLQADDMRVDANQKLNAFYQKAGGDQAAALSNPETARIKAVGDGMRDSLYSTLEQNASLPAGTIPGIQNRFGLVSEASDIANKREPVFARHDPISLPQAIAAGHGNPLGMATHFVVQKALRGATDSDALVNSAVDRYHNPDGTPKPARSGMFNRLGNAAAGYVGNAGNALRGIPMLRLSMAASPLVARNNQ